VQTPAENGGGSDCLKGHSNIAAFSAGVYTQKALIVEDEANMRKVLVDNFEHAGYSVLSASNGLEAWQFIKPCNPDIVISDVMMPKLNGFDLCSRIREEGFGMPIILLTAKGRESDIIMGLKNGADDYVTKPFSMKVLLAKAEAFLRRSDLLRDKNTLVSFGEFSVDLSARLLFRNGKEVALSPKEFGLINLFLQRPGAVITREMVLDAVWGQELFVMDRSVDRCITTLRNKIESNPRNPKFIQTIRGVGYRFTPGKQTAIGSKPVTFT